MEWDEPLSPSQDIENQYQLLKRDLEKKNSELRLCKSGNTFSVNFGLKVVIQVDRTVESLRLARLSLIFANNCDSYASIYGDTMKHYGISVPASPEVRSYLEGRESTRSAGLQHQEKSAGTKS